MTIRFGKGILCILLLSLSAILALRGFMVNRSVVEETLDKSFFVKENGLCVVYNKPLEYRSISDNQHAPRASSLRMYEGAIELKGMHALHNEIRERGTGLYSHWCGAIYFSSLDGSSPLINGRTYKVRYRRSSQWEYWSALLLVSLVLIVNAKKVSVIVFRLCCIYLGELIYVVWQLGFELRYLLLFAVGLNLVKQFCVPYLYNAVDSCCLFSWAMSSHFPHWRPMYLLYVRCVAMIFGANYNLGFYCVATNLSVTAIIVGQNIYFAVASVAFCRAVTMQSWKQYTLIVLLTFCPIAIFVNSVYMCSTLIGTTVLLVASCLSLVTTRHYRRSQVLAWVGVCVSLFIAFLTRHDAIVLVFLPVLPFVYRIVVYRRLADVRGLFVAGAVSFMVLVCANVSLFLIHKVFSIEQHEIFGRATVGGFLNRLIDDENARAECSKTMVEQTTDEEFRAAITAFWECKGRGWVPARQAIVSALKPYHEDVPESEVCTIAEGMMAKLFVCYVKSCSGDYMRIILGQLGSFVAWESTMYIDSAALSSLFFARVRGNYEATRNLTLDSCDYILLSEGSMTRRMFSWVSLRTVIHVLVVLLSINCCWVGVGSERKSIGVSLLVVALLYAVSVASVQIVIPRLMVVPFLLLFLAMCIFLFSDYCWRFNRLLSQICSVPGCNR